MLIECISAPRKGGTEVSLPVAGAIARVYHFKNPAADDVSRSAEERAKLADQAPHICEVTDETHVSMLLRVSEAFREYTSPLTPEEQAAADAAARAAFEAAQQASAAERAKAEAEEQARLAAEERDQAAAAIAAKALLEGRMTAEEAIAFRAGVSQGTVQLEPEGDDTAAAVRAAQQAAFEAQQAEDLARADAVREGGTMSLSAARDHYRDVTGKNPSPRWTTVEAVLDATAKAKAEAQG